MNEDFMEEIAEALKGTCDSIESVLEKTVDDPESYDVEQIEDDLLDLDVERCQGCRWWFECGELFSEDTGENGWCEDCRKENE